MTTNDLSDEESDSISVIVSDECDRNGDAPEDGSKIVSIFVGNLGERTGPCEIKNLFESFGVVVDHIDMKVCFAFVHCPWVSNISDLILKMQGCLFENSTKVPKIEITKGDGSVRKREERRHQLQSPSATLFVVGFDPNRTSEEAIVKAFSIVAVAQRVMIRRNFCFVKFDSIAEAVSVKNKFNGEEVSGRTLSIEFSSGADFSGDRRDQFISSIGPSGGTRDCGVDRGASRGRGHGNDQQHSDRGNEYSSHQSETNYPQNGRGSNHNNGYVNSDGFENGKGRDYGDSNRDGSSTQVYNDNHDNEKRRYMNRFYDEDRNEPSMKRRSQSGSNRRNRSRSRDKNGSYSHSNRDDYDGHVGDETKLERADRPLYGSGRGPRGMDMDGPTGNKAESRTSISVITLPFSTRDGRFIYEHLDGQREYVKPVFSSTIGDSDPIQSSDNYYDRYPSNRSSRGGQMDRQNEDFKQKRNGDERDRMNNNWDRTGDRERCFPQLPERRGSGESRSCST